MANTAEAMHSRDGVAEGDAGSVVQSTPTVGAGARHET